MLRPARLLLITILLTGAFYIASFVALGSGFPTIGSSGEDIVDWFSANGSKARLYAWCSTCVSAGLAVFAGLVSGVLPRPHRYIFLAGVLGFALTAQVQAWFWAGLAFHPDGLAPATARTLFDIATFWGPVVNASTVTMSLPFAALGLARDALIPRWLTALTLVFLVEQAIETVTIFGQTGFIAPGGAMNVYLGGILGFLWTGGVVHWAMGRMAAEARASAP
ncbi:MAG: hypothetical protein AAGH83_02935 [Pseudomonadota bacterium]